MGSYGCKTLVSKSARAETHNCHALTHIISRDSNSRKLLTNYIQTTIQNANTKVDPVCAHCWHHFPGVCCWIIPFYSSQIRWPVASQSINISITHSCSKATSTVMHRCNMAPLFCVSVVAFHSVKIRVAIITTQRIQESI